LAAILAHGQVGENKGKNCCQMSAFEMLQKDIHFVCEAPVLIYQFSPGNFILESDVCIGAVLSQVQGGNIYIYIYIFYLM
jgi:hypothetical protein